MAVAHPEIDKWRWFMLTLDALALGLFAVNGTAKGLDFHMSGMASVFLGMATALGGGLIRDMILNQVPVIVRDKHWYAFPASVGCILTVCVVKARYAGYFGLTVEILLDILIVALVVAMRLLSVKLDLTLFGAMNRTEPIKVRRPRIRHINNRRHR